MNKKIIPSEALERIADIQLIHMETDVDENYEGDLEYTQYEVDDGTIEANYPDEIAVLRKTVHSTEIIRKYGFHQCWEILNNYKSYEDYKNQHVGYKVMSKKEYILLKEMYKK